MGFDWTSVADTIKQSVTGFLGGEVTIARAARDYVEPIPDTQITANAEISPETGVFSAILADLDAQYREDTITHGANAMFVVSPGNFEPRPGDVLTTGDGKSYELLMVDSVKPNTSDVLIYNCMVAI